MAHMRVAEELENLYERKLATEVSRWEALRTLLAVPRRAKGRFRKSVFHGVVCSTASQ